MKKIEVKIFKSSLLLLAALIFFTFSSFSNTTYKHQKNKLQALQQKSNFVISELEHKPFNGPFKDSESEDIEIEKEIEDNELENYTLSTDFFHYSAFESDYFLSKVSHYKNTTGGFQFIPLYKLFHNWKTYLS